MIKLFNKLMYYFGYAPIKISHEVKYHIVEREIKFQKLKKEISVPYHDFTYLTDIGIKERVINAAKNELVKQLVHNSEPYIHFTRIDDVLNRKINFEATFLVGTNPDLK